MKTSILCFAMMCASCAAPDDETTGEVVQHATSFNGISLNGISLNGISLNGISLNGISLNGISLNGISLNGISLNGTSLTGAASTSGVVGSKWTATASNGETVALRIDAAAAGAAPNTDLWFYTISYQTQAG